jgi:hypothetical protein
MTQVDLGLTRFGRFDSADPVISVNDINQKPGAQTSMVTAFLHCSDWNDVHVH